MAAAPWSTQQLAEFVAAVSAAESEAAVALAAVERAADALEADVGAIVAAGEVVAAVGYADGAVPAGDLEAVKPGLAGGSLEVPGVGPCAAAAATLEHPPGATLVVARQGPEGLTREEIGLLRGMARVASLTMRMQRVLDRERAAREQLERLAGEQAALRRVATLVARGEPPRVVFAAVAEEVGRVVPAADVSLVGRYDSEGALEFVGGWSAEGDPTFVGTRVRLGGRNVSTIVFERNEPTRVDYAADDANPASALAREWARSSAGAPINVEGRLWGVMVVGSLQPDGLPPGIEHELAGFTELAGTALANSQAREELQAIADEQAGLRRVATLVAEAAPPEAVFTAVAEEIARILPAEIAVIGRYGDGSVTFLGGASGSVPFVIGTTNVLGGRNVSTVVHETGQSARLDSYAGASGDGVEEARGLSITSSVGVPIAVAGRLWGIVVAAATHGSSIPPDTEQRLAGFTELVATAIANSQAREELSALADWQAALRRVATQVARGEPAEAVFAAIAKELGALFRVDATGVVRYEPDDVVRSVGSWTGTGQPSVPGQRTILGGENVTTLVYETGRPARVDAYAADDASAVTAVARRFAMRSAVGAPIHVGGRLWGSLQVATLREDALPTATEERLEAFADLAATAIANAQAREELRTLADEQAALRRVATLVAEAVPAREIFAAVAEEVGRLLRAERTLLARFDADDVVTIVGRWGGDGEAVGLLDTTGLSGVVRDTRRPARAEGSDDAWSALPSVRRLGLRSAVAAPITVTGRLWGLIEVASTGEEPVPPETEERLAAFTELVATAISNTQAQAELTASRARVVATADETRHRIERDLHDGAQQRLVTLALKLRAAQASVPPDLDELAAELSSVALGMTSVLDELREFARGIHPAILSEAGLATALKSLARRCAVPVELSVNVDERSPEAVEVAAYYIVSEALANATKHAGASVISVEVTAAEGVLHVGVRDDGVGGADPARGSGLVGLKDRVEALGGRISVESPRGKGTSIRVELPAGGDAVARRERG